MLLKYAPFIKLFNLLKQVNYGITIDGKNINPFAVEDENFFADHYHYLSPEEFITNKCGVCWDYVSFQIKITM